MMPVLARRLRRAGWSCGAVLTLCASLALAGAQAPAWMHAQVGAELPPHDVKADAVLMYSESVLTVTGQGKMKRLDRRAYKILRPDGAKHGLVRVDHSSLDRIVSMHGWTIPAAGKDYEVRDKDAIDAAIPDVENGQLVSDLRSRMMRLPDATVGNIVGYEVEQEVLPYVLTNEWEFQDTDAVRESHYRLELPPGWSYSAAWINHAPIEAVATGAGRWEWSTTNVGAISIEQAMPPWSGIAQSMLLSLIPPAGTQAGIQNWNDMGVWYQGLLKDRRAASAPIKQKVAELTASASTAFAKMQALARFVQTDIRYVAIELGIGGWQPHAAADIFDHHFGDCKDKATLLSVMLQEIGVSSYHLIINTERGAVTATTPARMNFNHAIIAIALPAGTDVPPQSAVFSHPKLGKLLIFDPTDEYVPFGRLSGALQGSVAFLVTPDGGELIETPQLPSSTNGIARTARMTLDGDGNLSGDLRESRTGDRAFAQRYAFRNTSQETDRIRPVEVLASSSFGAYEIKTASVVGLNALDAPFEWRYSLAAARYAKPAGDLLLVRPRIIGSKSSALLETHEPRRFPIEFDGQQRDQDDFEIAIPAGYDIDELPPAVDVATDFADYHSKSEFKNHMLHYTRSFEIKAVSLPAERADELKRLYRRIADDERNTAVFKRTGS